MKQDETIRVYGRDLSRGRKLWDMLFPIVFLFLCILVVTMVVLMVTAVITGVYDYDSMLNAFPFLSLTVSACYYSITILLQRKNYKTDQIRFVPFIRKWAPSRIFLACLLAMAAGYLISALIFLSGISELFPGYVENALAAFQGQNPILLIFSTVIVGPIAEEMIFRGMMYRRMRNYLGIPAAMIVSSLIFGAYHANMVQFIYASLMGLLFVLLYERSRSLITCIAAHSAANLWAVIVDLFAAYFDTHVMAYHIFLAVQAAAVLILALFLIRTRKTAINL